MSDLNAVDYNYITMYKHSTKQYHGLNSCHFANFRWLVEASSCIYQVPIPPPPDRMPNPSPLNRMATP